jgi:hypothetical protein
MKLNLDGKPLALAFHEREKAKYNARRRRKYLREEREAKANKTTTGETHERK